MICDQFSEMVGAWYVLYLIGFDRRIIFIRSNNNIFEPCIVFG